MLLKIEPVARSNHDDIGWGICPRCKAAEYVPPSHTFAEPGVCPPIVSISYTANQFLIDGFFSTASFWLRGVFTAGGRKGSGAKKAIGTPPLSEQNKKSGGGVAIKLAKSVKREHNQKIARVVRGQEFKCVSRCG